MKGERLVRLKDYLRPRQIHQLDLETGQVKSEKPSGVVPEHGLVGFGSWRRVGTFRATRVFVAAFARPPSMVVRIGADEFDTLAEGLVARREALRWFRKRFSLTRADVVRFTCTYLYADWRTWPDDGDIFSFIARFSTDPKRIIRQSLGFWATSHGEDPRVPSFEKDLERRVDEALKSLRVPP